MPYLNEDHVKEDCTLEPIAVVGMSCRLPGGVDSSSSLWDLLVQKESVQTPRVPASRFNIDAYLHPNLERPGSFNVPGGYFLDKPIESFDPSFFNMTPIEAMWLDPQQRKILEVVYECFESAGLTLDQVSGSNTAVFVGSFTSDYQQMSIREPDFRHNYAATGVDTGLISARIGNVFNLQGPSFTINTACSSSIYAVHNACHALRGRDCNAAVVGGVNLIMTVDQHMNTAKLGILSPTSTCHTFDASADGYGRAEGAGALYLKRLSDAIRDGDVIRGVIRSSAVNTNGKVPGMGITHPSKRGQERVVRSAYEKARLNPDRTAYFECHGTGTPVGDPIESHAVSMAMNDTRSPEKPLLIGAIKANIGHSEAASGIFAVMKAAMMTEAGVIPGVCGLKNLNPAIKEDEWNIKVNANTIPWPADFSERRASVSSFGYGGTNGHVIVESIESLFPHYQQHGKTKLEASYDHSASRHFLLGFSAHEKTTLARNIVAHAQVADRYYLADVAHTLLHHRTKFTQRAFTVASETNLADAFDVTQFTYGVAPKTTPPGVGFLFTGQGAQWAGMGVDAIQTFPSFRQTIKSLDKVLQTLQPTPTWTIEEALLAPVEISRVSEAEFSQPLCTAVQIAIVNLFAEWNITPKVTVGHSSGEIAAAYAAGRISAPVAIIAAYLRGLTVAQHASNGGMLAVGLGPEEVLPYLEEGIVIACENSPTSVTLSGSLKSVQAVKSKLDADGVFARELKTGKAYHSPQMDPVSRIYDTILADSVKGVDTEPVLPRVAWVSSVTGQEFTANSVPESYWSTNLRERVRFNTAVTAIPSVLDENESITIIEIGPHAALSGPFKQIQKAVQEMARFNYLPTLVRGNNSAVQLLQTAGSLWIQDYPLDLHRVNAMDASLKVRRPRTLVDLPPYQWNYDNTFWAEPRPSQEIRKLTHPRHDLLGSRIAGLSDRSCVWRNILQHRDIPWLVDHKLGKANVFPAAGYLSVAAEALRQICENEEVSVPGITYRDVAIKVALIVPDTDDGTEIQVRLSAITKGKSMDNSTSGWYEFAVESIRDGAWTLHCEGRIATIASSEVTPRRHQHPVQTSTSKLPHQVPGKRWYDAFNRVGFEYGPSFQPLSSVRSNGHNRHAAAQVQINIESGLINGESRYILHPATIDGCLQLIIISINKGLHQEMPHGVVPIEIEELTLWFPDEKEIGNTGQAVAWTDQVRGRYFDTNTKLFTPSGQLVLDVQNLRCVSYEAAVPQVDETVERAPYMQTVWKPLISTLDTAQAVAAYPSAQSDADSVAAVLELMEHRASLAHLIVLGRPSKEVLEAVWSRVNVSIAVTIIDESNEYLDDLLVEKSLLHVSKVKVDSSDDWSKLDLAPADLVLAGLHSGVEAAQLLAAVTPLLAQSGSLLALVSPSSTVDFVEQLASTGLSAPQLLFLLPSISVVFSQKLESPNGTPSQASRVVTFYRDDSDQHVPISLGQRLESKAGVRVQQWALSEVTEFTPQPNEVFLIHDADGKLLSSLTEQTWDSLKQIIQSGVPTIWLTSGVNEGQCVEGTSSQGFLRAIRSEQANARIVLLDVDRNESQDKIAETLASLLDRVPIKDSQEETEFWLHNCILHIPRVIPNGHLNDIWSGPRGGKIQHTPLPRNQLLVAKPVVGELVFYATELANLAANELELQVQDAQLFEHDLKTVSVEPRLVAGTIIRVGAEVDSSLIGSTAITYTSGPLSTLVKTTLTAVGIYQKKDSNLNIENAVTILPGFVSAINAILGAAQVLGKTHHLILLPAPYSFVQAAVRLQRALGFKLTIFSADEEQRELISSSPGLGTETHLDVADVDRVRGILQTSFNPAAHVSIVSYEWDTLSRDAWRSIPALGRFVLNGTVLDEAPDAVPFQRGASFQSTSIESLYKSEGPILGSLIKRALQLLEENNDLLFKGAVQHKITSLGGSIVDAANWSSGSNVLQFNYDDLPVQIHPAARKLQLSPDVAYLLVGCLGGLGRSLTTWMMERGARDFVFLSRSGDDKAEAKSLVKSLQVAGARVQVFRVDASDVKGVTEAVNQVTSQRSIRGVVHAAMVLQDGIYDGMSYDKFQAALVPKMNGARNLHEVLQGHALDFFVMTSSISATLGNPGQANYCAGNSYLDGLAWHRNQLGLPGVSLILPMILDVGVVSEDQSLEASLTRKAMYGIDEREMLRGFEISMAQPIPQINSPHILGDSQIILGMEPARLEVALTASQSTDAYWYNDARFRGIRHTVESLRQISPSGDSGDGDIMKILKEEGPEAMLQAIGQHIMKKLAGMLLVPLESFEYDGSSIASCGIDSMIGAELRNWLFKQYSLDIAFQELLAPKMSVKALATAIAVKLGPQSLDATNVFDDSNGHLSSGDSTPDSSKETVQVEDERNKYRSIHGVKWFLAVLAIFSSVFLFGLDTTAVADISPAMISRFGQADLLPWLSSGYALGAMNILPWGKSFGVFNLKWTYILTVALFEVGSAICGAAPNMTALIIGRVIAGIGGSGMYLGCITYLAMTTSPREGPHYIGLVGFVWGIGTVLGPIVGGAFADSSAGWRWTFYINLLIAALFAPVYFFLLPNIDAQPTATLIQKHKQVDWVSIVFLNGFITCFVMAINFGGAVYAWNSAQEIVLWVMTGVIFVGFLLVQYFHPLVTKEQVLFPGHLLKRPLMLNLTVQMILSSGVLQGAIYYIPLFFEFAKSDAALEAAVRLLPYVFMLVAGCLINAALMVRFGYYMPWYFGGGALVVISSALMCTVNAHTSNSTVYGYTVLMGIGVGSYCQASYTVSQQLVPMTELTNVIGLMSISQFLGILFFLAIMGTSYQNLVIEKIHSILPNASDTDVRQFIAGTSSSLSASLTSAQSADVVNAIVAAMRSVWILLAVAGGICVILSLFLGRPGRRQLPKQGGAASIDIRIPADSIITTIDDSSTRSLVANLDQLADDLIWDGQSSSTDFLIIDPSLNVPKSTEAAAPTMTTAPVVDTTPDLTFGLQGWGMDPSELLAALTAPPKASPLADAGFLTRLPIDDPIAQRHATYLIQILRPFPQMMARRAIFPPFVHQNWHHGDGPKVRKALPEPIGNCMSIAQIFASRTPDTRSFVWNAIRTEQQRLMVQSETFGSEDLLASIQSYIIYIIMRVIDDAAYHSEHDLNMLLNFATLCSRFRTLCQGPFSLPEQTHPSRGWSDWVFAESRRRVACIWFLIGQVVVTKTGIPCDTSEEYHCLPLPGGRSLWECRTNQGWEAEYSATQTTIPGRQLTYFGDLMDAQKANSDPSMIQKMDSWNAEADTLGFMLTLATAMV
ncbi:putative polyketide synthase [Penicillium brasilianum]|nr:putative polyketide synthase [Penicillium brasilianum]